MFNLTHVGTDGSTIPGPVSLFGDVVSSKGPLIYGLMLALSTYVLSKSIQRHRSSKHFLPLPPGPPPKLFIGNTLDLPITGQSEKFTEWKHRYGDLTYINVLGMPIVITSSLEVAKELMERRSSIYCSRATFWMLNSLVCMSWNFVFMEYGKFWRKHRRVFHEIFHSQRVSTYENIQLKHIKTLLKTFPGSDEKIGVHLKRFTCALLLDSVYGFQLPSYSESDPLVYLTSTSMHAVDMSITPGKFYVEAFPLMRFVPSWFPGTQYLQTAAHWKEITTNLLNKPFQKARAVFASRTEYHNEDSFISEWLTRIDRTSRTDQDVKGETEAQLQDTTQTGEVVRNVAAAALLAGTETTADTLHKLVLALLLHPNVQARAQEELDNVVGRKRLPTLADEADLPYIGAVVKEVLRWEILSPIGFPHRAIREDTYRGYRIPKDTLLIVNVRDIAYNEELYGPNTKEFRPERFSEPGVADTGRLAFGFGRRVCPGRHLAYQSLFMVATHMLHLYNITKRLDENGCEIPVKGEFVTTMETIPLPFDCLLIERFEKAVELLD